MTSPPVLGRVCDSCRPPCCRRLHIRRLVVMIMVFVLLLFCIELWSRNTRRRRDQSFAAWALHWQEKHLGAGKLGQKDAAEKDWPGADVDKLDGNYNAVAQHARRVSDEDQKKSVNPVFMAPGQNGFKANKFSDSLNGRKAELQYGENPALLKSLVKTPMSVKMSARMLSNALTARSSVSTARERRYQEVQVHHMADELVQKSTLGVGVEPLALLILKPVPFFSISLADMRELLTKHKIKFEVGLGASKWKSFFPQSETNPATKLARYSVIIFEDWSLYSEASQAKRKTLDSYCLQYGVGVVAFVSPKQKIVVKKVAVRPLFSNLVEVKLAVNGKSPVLRIVKDGGYLKAQATPNWCTFDESLASTFSPLETMTPLTAVGQNSTVSQLDSGRVDGIRRVLFCRPAAMTEWLHKALFLDAVSYLSPAMMGLPLSRRFIMDIDDIFVAPLGTKMSPQDVQELVKTQEEVRKRVPNFTYNLGFVGSRFANGTTWEIKGDHHFVKMAKHFYWFPHMYSHRSPHKISNTTQTIMEMHANKQFAKEMGIPVSGKYAVAPKHSGVYPVHEPLYTAWREVWDVKSTSTEEYMHLKPGYKRRGFVYRGIKVIPRQTCGLFTHTFKKAEYPGGFERLIENTDGGDMFESILHNTICIFMTHVSNYGHDRLGNHVTKAIVAYIQTWTNLELSYAPPHIVADEYFEQHLDEVQPFWLDPCRDPRHYAIWNEEFHRCYNLPHALIVGPQKTGTTALLDFLTMHPNITRNRNTATHFEEMQFFSSDVNYNYGLDWYMQHMPLIHNKTEVVVTYNASDLIEKPEHIIIEKSATYFDSYLAPLRAWRLLPSVKIIVILTDPVKRAYSWWQHQVAHHDAATQRISFKQLLLRKHHRSREKAALKQRCLFPGQYATHLKRWMAFLPRSQIHIVDGEKLSQNPVPEVMAVQHFLNITVLDYSKMIKKSEKKGFYCPVVRGALRCLGKGKGRVYPPMDPAARIVLQQLFASHNRDLARLLLAMKVPFPAWLKESIARKMPVILKT